jgi:hypothetical protein
MFSLQVTFLGAFTVCVAVPERGLKSTNKNNPAHTNLLMAFLEKVQTKVLKETEKTITFDTDTVSLKQKKNFIIL